MEWDSKKKAAYRKTLHWRSRVEKVKARDKVCRICGSRKALCVHHNNPNEAYDADSIKNLLLLCRSCHLHIMHKNLPEEIREAVNKFIQGTEND